MDRKKIIFAIFFVLTSIGLGSLLFYVFFYTPSSDVFPPVYEEDGDLSGAFPSAGSSDFDNREPSSPQQNLPSSNAISGNNQQIANAPTQIVKEITSGVVSSATLSNDGKAKFYNEQDGKFYKVDANGNIIKMSDKVFFNVENVNWSPTSEESIIEYPDGSNIYFNFETNEQVTLPKHWEDFSFEPSGKAIVAKSMSLSPENRWLISSNPKGGNIELIEPLGNNAEKVIVDWSPNKQIVAISQTGESIGLDRQDVLPIGRNGENFPAITVEGRGLVTNWSRNGSKLLYSVHSTRSDSKPELWIVNSNPETMGTGRNFLQVNTWADKCAFSDDRFIYCGVPVSLDPGVGFIPSLADEIPDELYKIDTQTGLKTKIPFPEGRNIDSLSVDKSGKKLIFTDTNIPGLFEVDL